jgi:hypothetical protein
MMSAREENREFRSWHIFMLLYFGTSIHLPKKHIHHLEGFSWLTVGSVRDMLMVPGILVLA